jgi:hypothetical protein
MAAVAAAAAARRVGALARHVSLSNAAATWCLARPYHVAGTGGGGDGKPELGIRALIVGPPGAGKGTLSSRLVRDFGFHTIGSGDAFRDHISRGAFVEAVV